MFLYASDLREVIGQEKEKGRKLEEMWNILAAWK